MPELIQKEGLVFEKFYALIQKYADAHGYYYINQGRNPENPLAHYRTTGPEIWEATGGKVDYLVLLAGTGGSMVGIGKYLKEKNKNLKIIGVQPAKESLKDPKDPEKNTIDGVLAFHNVRKKRRFFISKNLELLMMNVWK